MDGTRFYYAKSNKQEPERQISQLLLLEKLIKFLQMACHFIFSYKIASIKYDVHINVTVAKLKKIQKSILSNSTKTSLMKNSRYKRCQMYQTKAIS